MVNVWHRCRWLTMLVDAVSIHSFGTHLCCGNAHDPCFHQTHEVILRHFRDGEFFLDPVKLAFCCYVYIITGR